jgi:benzoyl-CoA reductase/2-hydroxyglutaryl-CoA dehydratase subunit BcrC/BadD/HgdB
MEQVAATIEEWKVEGLINITLHSCHPFGIESRNIEKVCKDCNTPYLHIETDFYPGDEGQIRTRIEAFLEMIIERR